MIPLSLAMGSILREEGGREGEERGQLFMTEKFVLVLCVCMCR